VSQSNKFGDERTPSAERSQDTVGPGERSAKGTPRPEPAQWESAFAEGVREGEELIEGELFAAGREQVA